MSEIIRQFLSSWQYQLSHFCNVWSCWARKMEVAELSSSCTQHIASPCAWYQHTSVNGMSSLQVSALKGNSALRAHVARVVGIELAHTEGQYVIHFLWDMRKLCDSIKAHLLIPQLVARGYPLEILVSGLVDTEITEMSSSWQRIQRRHHGLCIQHFDRLSPELLLGQRTFV